MQGFISIALFVILGFIFFCVYFIFKQMQFVIQAINLYKKMITRQDMMIKLLNDIKGGSPDDIKNIEAAVENSSTSNVEYTKEIKENSDGTFTVMGRTFNDIKDAQALLDFAG